MNVAIFGIQGSGKGTQAKIMAERYNLASFETGEECRRLAKEDSELGHKIKKIVASGNLVPAQIILQILENFLSKTPSTQSIIFDGIPRNQKQQKEFDRIMKKWKRPFIALNIDIPEDETIKRLATRGRHDDTPEIIKNRIKIFLKNTRPVIEKYRKQGKVIDVNGHQSINKVASEIHKKIDPHFLTKKR
jgi:adenylate kinase